MEDMLDRGVARKLSEEELQKWSGDHFSKVPIINVERKAVVVYMQDRNFASNMIKLLVNETKWSSLLAWTFALTLYISI